MAEAMVRSAANSRWWWLAASFCTLLIIAAYANSLHNSFHFDDSHVIQSNVYIRSLHNVPLFFRDAHTFSSLPQNSTYRPLVTLSLSLDYMRGALDPYPYHVTQIVLLILAGALLVVFFVPLIGEWPTLFAATLFCLHTANTETMNLISARSELLSTVGLLGSFVLFQRSLFARRTLLYLVPLAVGALAKAPLVVFAPLLFLYIRWFDDKQRAWRESLPPLILGVALLAFLNSMNAPEWQSGAGSQWHYLITQPFVWMHYVRLFLLPIGLTADTDWGTFDHWYDTRAIAGDAFVALLLFSIWRVKNRAVKFGLAWFAIALIPTSIFPLAEVANEHRLFFAFIGLVLALAAAVPRDALPFVAVIVLTANLIGTHERNKVWRTEDTLWADVVVKSPGNGRAWMNYGLTRMAKGAYGEAKNSFERAAVLTPNYWVLEINRGIVEGELGNQAAAEQHFHRALDLNADANAHFFFARWLVQHGRAREALPHLRDALRISPAFAEARALLLRLDAAGGDDRGLRALMEETRRIDPGEPALADVTRVWPSFDAALAACTTATHRADWLAAAYACRNAVGLDPHSADAVSNEGLALQKLGFR